MHSITRITFASTLLLALSSLAMADGDSSLRAFTVTERVTAFTSLDLGAPGAGPGDQFTGTGDLTDARGQKVGTSTYTCITAAPGLSQCAQVYDLPGGKIMTTGTAHPDFSTSPIYDERMAIVGGTGRYAGATGELRLVQLSTSEATLTFHVSR